MDIKNLLQPILELVFSSNSQFQFLSCINGGAYYNTLTWILLITPIVLLIVFYRGWDPLTKQLSKWIITGIVIALITFISTRIIFIEANPCMIAEMDQYDGSGLNPNFFVYSVSTLIAGISLVLTFLYSLVIKRISINNSHNPF